MGENGWGIAGFGEVGSTFARQLHMAGQSVRVADPALMVDPLPSPVRERLEGLDVEVDPDVTTLAARSDIVLSVVTPSMAPDVARAAARAGGTGIFVDFNSISPAEKRRLADRFREGTYVDGAILGSITAEQARAPLALSGAAAEKVARRLGGSGFNVAAVQPEVGAASALKMCRSIFMKGVECLFLETVLAANEFGIRREVLASIEQTFSSLGFGSTVDMLLTSHAVHSERRAHEMAGVVEMLNEMCLPSRMSAASRDVLKASAESGLKEHTGGTVPAEAEAVTSYLVQFYRERCP